MNRWLSFLFLVFAGALLHGQASRFSKELVPDIETGWNKPFNNVPTAGNLIPLEASLGGLTSGSYGLVLTVKN